MKAIEMHSPVTVKCDLCDWIERSEDAGIVEQYHNKPCPKCGKGVIINDDELELFNFMVAMSQTELPETKDDPMPVTVEVDSSFLRTTKH